MSSTPLVSRLLAASAALLCAASLSAVPAAAQQQAALIAPSSLKPGTPVSAPAPLAAPSKTPKPAADDDATGPGLKETTEWLGAHLTGQTASYIYIRTPEATAKKLSPAPEVFEVKDTVTSATFGGCHLSLSVEHTATGSGMTTKRTTQFVIPLENMESIYLGVAEHQPKKGGYSSEEYMPKTMNMLHIGGPRPEITYTDATTTITGAKTTEGEADTGTYHLVEIGTDDTAMAKRLSMALKHAMRLCQAAMKPEPF